MTPEMTPDMMPGVTKLLNLKSLKVTPKGPSAPLPPPPVTGSADGTPSLDPVLELSPAAAPISAATLPKTLAAAAAPVSDDGSVGISLSLAASDELVTTRLISRQALRDAVTAPNVPVAPPAQAAKPALRAVARRATAGARGGGVPVPALARWETSQLKAARDPMGQGLAQLLERGATAAVYLAITAPAPGSPVPTFIATAYMGPIEKSTLWAGMRWDPQVSPDLWNDLVRRGYAELQPSGTTTNVQSARNVTRLAFGAESNETILILRAGPPNACRGLLAVVAERSLVPDLGGVLPLIGAPLSR